jgi:class 3 adenylate cyclase/pimeloyl-ACP methyl ester carboxylesterase
VDAPDVEYARSGELSIAYQVLGDGPIDLVFVPFSLSAIFSAQHPPFSMFYERLASFSRLILFDKRGIGASDRPRTPPTLEAQMDDVRAVLEAVGSEQAALFGTGHGAQMCALFAATYPERTSALVLYVPWPGRLPGTPEEHRRMLRRVREETGRSEAMERMMHEQYPSLAGDEEFLRAFTSIVRASHSPGTMAEFMRTVVEADLSDVWSTIRVPTLVLYRKETFTPETAVARGMADARAVEEGAKAVAAAIPNAYAIGVGGRDYAPFVGDQIPDEVERFLSAPLAEPVPERVLATVLFTDIVGSTEWATSLGDSRWREVLASHRASVRRELGRFAGTELDTAGDGFFASFDGPARGIACADTIVHTAAQDGLEIRAGLHTGECEREGDKLAGIAVHIGARIAALAMPGEVLVSRTVKDLVAGSGIEFDDRGEHELKGVRGAWQLYAVKMPV